MHVKSLFQGVKSRLHKQFFRWDSNRCLDVKNHLYIPEQSGNGTDHLTILLSGFERPHPLAYTHAYHTKDDWFGIRPFAQHVEEPIYSKSNEESSIEQKKIVYFF
jgi:hypothetical protein